MRLKPNTICFCYCAVIVVVGYCVKVILGFHLIFITFYCFCSLIYTYVRTYVYTYTLSFITSFGWLVQSADTHKVQPNPAAFNSSVFLFFVDFQLCFFFIYFFFCFVFLFNIFISSIYCLTRIVFTKQISFYFIFFWPPRSRSCSPSRSISLFIFLIIFVDILWNIY